MECRWLGGGGVVLRASCKNFYNMRNVAEGRRPRRPHLDLSSSMRSGSVADNDVELSHDHFSGFWADGKLV